MRFALVLLVLAGFAALVTGCGGGGSDRLSKEEYVAAADKICAEADAAISALGEPTEENIEEYVANAETIANEQLAKLRALKPPAVDEETLNHAYDLIEEQVGLAKQGVDALKSQNQAEFERINAEIQTVNAESDKIAQDYGLKECGNTNA